MGTREPGAVGHNGGMDGVQEVKAQRRAAVRAARREVVAAQGAPGRSTQAHTLASVFLDWVQGYAATLGRVDLAGLTVTAYRALPAEPPLGELIRACLAAGMRVLVPVTVADSPVLAWVPATPATGEGVLAEVLGGTEPDGSELGPEVLPQVDIALIPGLAVDAGGHRLGQGGGYYDRALPRLRPEVPIIVALHDHEAPPAAHPTSPQGSGDAPAVVVPHAAHDIPVDGVLTTTGVHLLH